MRRRMLALALLLSVVGSVAPAQSPEESAQAEGHFQAGLAHLRDGRAAMAVDAFERAVRLDKDNPYFRKGLGQALASQGRYDDAIGEFEKALEINPHYVDVRNDLGSVLMLAGKRSEGMAQFLQAYNDPTNPTPAVTARNLGLAYFELGSHDEALNWFRTALSRDRDYAGAHIGIADTLVAMGKVDEAVLQLEGAVDALPDVVPLTLALGEAYYRASRFEEARKRLEQVVQRDPGGAAGLRAADLLQKFP